MRNANNSGFTMVEMAIVLVVLASIVAGLLAARDLINSSGARSVISEVNAIKESVRGFKDRYRQLPGDFNRARTASGIPGIWETATPATGNGNGDGIIALDGSESLRVWQHLALANGDGANSQYTGTGNYAFGTNLPASKIGGAGYRIINGNPYSTAPYNVAPYTNTITVSGTATQIGTMNIELANISGNAAFAGNSIDPIRALFIDNKIDDSFYNSGEVVALPNAAPCRTAAAPIRYNSTTDAISCRMSFRIRN